MSSRLCALVAVLLVSLAAIARVEAAPEASWLEAKPETPEEKLLRDAIERGAFGGLEATVSALDRLSSAHPGAVASGLAQLAAGLRLIEADQPQQALVRLRHEDVHKTALADHALLATARAWSSLDDPAAAAQAYLTAADVPGSPVLCTALFAAAEALAEADRKPEAIESLNRAHNACPRQEPRALAALGELHDTLSAPRSAATVLDRLDQEYPASPEAEVARRRLQTLSSWLPKASPEVTKQRDLGRALALFEAGQYRQSVPFFQKLKAGSRLSGEEADLVHVRLGRALAATRRNRQARQELDAVSAGSAHAGEAAYHRARLERGSRRVKAMARVADRFDGGDWGEQALFYLGNNFQRQDSSAEAVPYYREMLRKYPEGRHLERAAWYVGWSDLRSGRLSNAARVFERTARLRPSGRHTSSFLYWGARAHLELGQQEKARRLLVETVRRFKYAYYGTKSREILGARGWASDDEPVLRAGATPVGTQIPEPQRTRVRQLLLIDRLVEARAELDGLAPTQVVQATIASIEHRRGRLRPAITAMKQAFPGYFGEAGDHLPRAVWRILYPLAFGDSLEASTRQQRLDPALVAALIRQESTFDPGAVSRAGARGLMQIMPSTGRGLARTLRLRYRRSSLHDPGTSLKLGTLYLRQMLNRFDGRVEQALAAYNAGPRRVRAWRKARPGLSAEEFIESIPFTETRNYVKIILAAREQYRWIHSLAPAPAGAATTGGH